MAKLWLAHLSPAAVGQLGLVLEPRVTLVILLVAALAGLVCVCWRHPVWLLRAFLWLMCRTLYRVRVYGRDNVPAEGPALLVCNHVTYVDWVLIMAAQKRFVRFVIFAGWTRKWGLRHLLRWGRVIPIDAWAGPRRIVESLRAASDALAAGDLVCIFAEGRFTRTGFLLPFHRGFEQIVKRCPAPIVPVCLDQLWGSIFSFRGGKLIWKWPQQLPKQATVAFGAPLPPTATAAEVRLAIQKLSADCAAARSDLRRPVHRRFVRQAARHPFRPCLISGDGRGEALSYGQVLASAMGLARRLRPLLAGEELVGICLPPSVPGALANIALSLLGKTALNLDHTAPVEAVRAAIEQCGARHILSTGDFLTQVKQNAPPGVATIDVDDIRAGIAPWQQMRSFLKILLLPGAMLERRVLGLSRHSLDSLAAVVFTARARGHVPSERAGTSGQPRAVLLSQRSIAANAEAMVDAIDVRPVDRALGLLPFCTAVGYMANLWVPLQVGAGVVFPGCTKQGKQIGELCRTHRCSVLLTTEGLLGSCLDQCAAGDFSTLRVLMCGPELPPALAKDFEAKLGIQPLAGYACAELAGAAAANVPDKEMEKFRQIGHKPGTIGQPLPGLAARIVHPETFESLPPGQQGLLLFYGASLMKGYLGHEDWTRQVVRDGWFVTGELAKIDEDGFITLTGRRGERRA